MAFVPSKVETSITLGIDPSAYYDNDKRFRRNSCYRAWRALTRVQKMLFTILLLTFVSLIYVFFFKTHVPIHDLEADTAHRHGPHDEINPLRNPRKINRKMYEEELHRKLDSNIRELKRKSLIKGKGQFHTDEKIPSDGLESKKDSLQKEIDSKISKMDEVIKSGLVNGNAFDRPKTETVTKSLSEVNNDLSIKGEENAKVDVDLGKGEDKKVIDENEKEFRQYVIINGTKVDAFAKKKASALLSKYAKIDTTDYARHPENIPLTDKQKEVVKACKHAWDGYKKYAWGYDELKPISKGTSQWFMLGLTIVDSLDTLWLLNMKKEYKEGRDWVENELSFGRRVPVNLFETTIRVLGGLLSIFHLTADHMFLEKAEDLGDRLMGAFKSSSSIPFSDVVLGDKSGRPPAWSPDSSLSEVTTIQLEFKDLSYVLDNPRFKSASQNVMLQIFSLPRNAGLAPIYINAGNGQFRPGSHITLGARGDSYYEYLLKQWLQTGKKDDQLKEEYLKAMDGVKKLLVKKSEPSKLTYVGELLSGRSFSPKMDHLVCFLPGTLALGYMHGLPRWHLELAEELIETCNQMYVRMETGLSPEIVFFNQSPGGSEDLIVKPQDAHNLLRPETVESLHIMYSITKDKKYQDYGWNILKSFNKYSRVDSGGYVSLNNVRSAKDPQPGGSRDKMESFFVAETLKYLFLLFSDVDVLPLDKWVFNTEAHPLPIIRTR